MWRKSASQSTFLLTLPLVQANIIHFSFIYLFSIDALIIKFFIKNARRRLWIFQRVREY